MRVAIVGSRDYPDLEAVDEYVADLNDDDVVVSGGAQGVDSRAAKAARARGLKVVEYHAQWDLFGKSAGYRRNKTIVENADRVVAFQHNKSRGTQHTIDIAREAGMMVEVW